MKVMDIDVLCLVCGYFTRDTDANNGYGCNHPGNDGGTRSSCLWACANAIEKKRPQFLLMENVKALLSKRNSVPTSAGGASG